MVTGEKDELQLKKQIAFLIFALIILSFTSCDSKKISNISYDSSTGKFQCRYDNKQHQFILCLSEKTKDSPLVFMLHGAGQNSIFFRNETDFEKTACPNGYGVVYVDSTSDTGWIYSDSRESESELNFLDALAKYLQEKYGFSTSMTYAAGFSSGAFMCTKLAVCKPKTFSAVVSVGGMMPENIWNIRKTNVSPQCGFFQINGTKDPVVPMDFLKTSRDNPNPSIEKTIEYFSGKKNSANQIHSTKLSDKSTLFKYSQKVWWLVIEDETHRWPKSSWSGVDTNEIILEYFEQLNKKNVPEI